MAHGYKEGFWLNKQMLTKYVQMWAHRATVWELLWEIWERRARHGKHPRLVTCPLPTWVDTGTVNPYKVWLLTPRGFLWYTWYELKPIMFKIALPFSICASEKGTYKRKVFQNPNSGIDPKWGIFFASSPWMFSFECWNSPPGSSLGARHPGEQSRPQCSLHNTLQAWPGAIIMAGTPSFWQQAKMLFASTSSWWWWFGWWEYLQGVGLFLRELEAASLIEDTLIIFR